MELIPLSALNHYVYCPRRAALIHVEGIFEENEHTILGELVHEHADLPGYEVANGVLLWRSLPVWSERLGLSGKCDIVEVHPRPASGHPLPSDGRGSEGEGGTLLPVEYKKGKRRRFDNDDAQLCAQALCLEEMFGIAVPRGAVFHAESKRRREVAFTAELRSLVERSLGELRRLLDAQRVPRAVFKPACEECSLFEVCLPKAIEDTGRLERGARLLFDI